MQDGIDHAALVDRWLRQTAGGASAQRRLQLLEGALRALWRRAHGTLGEVTLGAVTERVLYHAAERFPFLSALRVEGDGVHLAELEQRPPAVDEATLVDAVRFVLVEFLSVLGNLTADIMTPALHAELAGVATVADSNGERPRVNHRGAKESAQ